ncbi:MAG: cadherin domain-containing protein, partial [Planctomycetota bacterium]
MTTTDVDAGNTFTYSLVTGAGDADNGSFNINSTKLRATDSFNFETKSSYTIRVRSTDQGGLFTEKTVAITVTNVNETPTDIGLSASSIAENAGANAVVGALSTTDPDASNTFTYSLVTGAGDADNGSFNISGNSLRATDSFNFETKSSYTVRIRSTDQGGLFTEKTFTISVTNVNEAPTDIALSSTSIAENAGANAVVGALSTTDVDAGNTFTYTLVPGTGDTDNGAFNIDDNNLRATGSFDFETKSSYTVRVRSTDQGGLFTEKTFTITVTNVNETPTDIGLSSSSIAENAGANAVVGALSTTDPDASNTFTYSLVTGAGDADNGSFNINGSNLRATSSFDFETKSSYTVRVRSPDQGGLFTEKTFAITVTNVNETPTDIGLSSSSIAENAGANAVVGALSTTDPDASNTFTYSLVTGA